MFKLSLGKLVIAASVAVIPSSMYAATIPFGTVSSVGTFNPSVSVSSTGGTYSATNGSTFEISGTDGFSAIGGTTGTLNGTLSFSSVVGTMTSETINNFFVFSDNKGGNYDFSVSSVMTNAFVNMPGVTTSGTLYLLGTTTDSGLGFATATPTSLTIQYNSTSNSSYSSALSLAIPPAGTSVTPEPSSLILLGTGLLGVAGVARRRFSL